MGPPVVVVGVSISVAVVEADAEGLGVVAVVALEAPQPVATSKISVISVSATYGRARDISTSLPSSKVVWNAPPPSTSRRPAPIQWVLPLPSVRPLCSSQCAVICHRCQEGVVMAARERRPR